MRETHTVKRIVAGDPETHSSDIVADNLERLKGLFPEAFTEGKVDFDVLRQLLGDAVHNGEEKYGLNWHGKRRARQLALSPSNGTLRPCPDDSVDWDNTQNLMIEGDNLEVLKLLQKSYAGKVKLIYIDPPYNTGNDFVYPDDYTYNLRNYFALTGQIDGEGRKLSSNAETSGRFHTDWSNMMYPRLKNFLLEMKDGMVPVDLWHYKETGTTDEGGQEVKGLFGDAVFDNPKPTRLIRRIVSLVSSIESNNKTESSIVLDFFSGSATTGHAVMASNVEDAACYRYILVQLPEPLDPTNKDHQVAAKFCEKLRKPRTISELTKERLRRAAGKIKNENPSFTGDLGFRVFKLDKSNIRAWDPSPEDLEGALLSGLDHIEPGRTKQDILYELLLKFGLDLCVPIQTRTVVDKSIHSVGAGTLIACLDEAISRDDAEPLAEGIADWHDELAPAGDSTVVFRDSAFAGVVA